MSSTALDNGHVQITDNPYPQRDGSLMRETERPIARCAVPVGQGCPRELREHREEASLPPGQDKIRKVSLENRT